MRRCGALFNPGSAASRKNDYRRARGVIDREGKKKFAFDVDLFFHQHRFDWKLADLHREHSFRVIAHFIRLLRKRDAANPGASSRPGLDLNHDFAAELLGRSRCIIGIRRGATAWNFKSVGGEDRFTLVFVKSCHR